MNPGRKSNFEKVCFQFGTKSQNKIQSHRLMRKVSPTNFVNETLLVKIVNFRFQGVNSRVMYQ